MNDPIPTRAVTAAYKRLADALAGGHYGQAAGRLAVRDALEAALPSLLAAEHRRLRDLAREHGHPEFASLIVPERGNS